jgi:hypothetical protein
MWWYLKYFWVRVMLLLKILFETHHKRKVAFSRRFCRVARIADIIMGTGDKKGLPSFPNSR